MCPGHSGPHTVRSASPCASRPAAPLRRGLYLGLLTDAALWLLAEGPGSAGPRSGC